MSLSIFQEAKIMSLERGNLFTAAKKNETTMSQMTSLEKAVKAWVKLRVLVKMETVTARNAHAPVGRGSSTRPAMAEQHQSSRSCKD